MDSTNSEAVRQNFAHVTWLDCTLRDGGYFNSWDFPLDIVQSYIYAMAECVVDRVELGFRSPAIDRYRGFAAYTPDSVIASLDVPSSLNLGVMVNTSEISGSASQIAQKLSQLFPPSSRRQVSLVRLATHLEEIGEALISAEWLKTEGYEVGLNLMQVSEASAGSLREIVTSINADAIDVLYIADSLGNLGPSDITSIISTLKHSWVKPLGVHAHDNRGLALANSLAALDAGATWVDSTITGMGRGAGNTQSEILVGHLDERRNAYRKTHSLDRLITDYFSPLKEECGWGVNSHYVRAASSGIHPTFIQELLTNTAYSPLEIDAAIDVLGASGAQRFSRERLNEATTFVEIVESPRGDWDQADLFAGKKVLLVGSGSSAATHSHALAELAAHEDVVVVAANLGPSFTSELIDVHIACHPLRIIADAHLYSTLGKPLIAPQELLPADTLELFSRKGTFHNLGLRVAPSVEVRAQQGLIELPKAQVLAYGLLACLSGGATEVMLAGFDGFGAEDPRRADEQNLLDAILGLNFRGKVAAITPTKHSLPLSSIYGILG